MGSAVITAVITHSYVFSYAFFSPFIDPPGGSSPSSAVDHPHAAVHQDSTLIASLISDFFHADSAHRKKQGVATKAAMAAAATMETAGAVIKLVLYCLLLTASLADWIRHRRVESKGWKLQRAIGSFLLLQVIACGILVAAISSSSAGSDPTTGSAGIAPLSDRKWSKARELQFGYDFVTAIAGGGCAISAAPLVRPRPALRAVASSQKLCPRRTTCTVK